MNHNRVMRAIIAATATVIAAASQASAMCAEQMVKPQLARNDFASNTAPPRAKALGDAEKIQCRWQEALIGSGGLFMGLAALLTMLYHCGLSPRDLWLKRADVSSAPIVNIHIHITSDLHSS